MYLKRLELNGFKSFAKKSELLFDVPIVAIVGPNGSGKSNIVESIRFVLGEQSVKSMRGKTGSDLIFKGSRSVSKMSRASVNIIFDNRDRVFHIHDNNTKIDIDFDEIVIGREVFIDGGNKYTINGNTVRMKDIHELISSVNIGSSGHHIISQGEADRYLNASIKDRRELIEEALGLKIYQYRIKESLRKLDKAEINMRESEILRRELAPHLRFLKRQVDKIEKSKKLREDLSSKYQEYFLKEDFLIKSISEKINLQKNNLNEKIINVNTFFSKHDDPENNIKKHKEETFVYEKKILISELQEKVSLNTLELGKIEGMISLLKKQEDNKKNTDKKSKVFSYVQVKDFFNKIIKSLDLLNAGNINRVILDIKLSLDSFIKVDNEELIVSVNDNTDEIKSLESKRQKFFDTNHNIKDNIFKLEKEISNLENVIYEKRKLETENQKQYYEYIARKKELDIKKEVIFTKLELLNKRVNDRDEEYNEAKVLLGTQEISYKDITINENIFIDERSQEQLRRELERTKIRLEDIGGGSGIDTIKEYEDTLERDNFLSKEIIDITYTIKSLNNIIFDLKNSLNTEFNIGVEKINIQFDRFFKLMFGGGSAELEFVSIKKRNKKIINDIEKNEFIEETEDDDTIGKEYGINIKVKLPRKKVSDLEMLSGGERSLTSIALLFALSQVNPPPFLVLDETDAALDEANSQKYGDMIEALSEFSQLILVTHNRETMSRAQTLFGVTLGRDDYSTMLSLRLEDATQYAK